MQNDKDKWKIPPHMKVGDAVAFTSGRNYHLTTLTVLTPTQAEVALFEGRRFNRDNGRKRGQVKGSFSPYHTISCLTDQIMEAVERDEHRRDIANFVDAVKMMKPENVSRDQLARMRAVWAEGDPDDVQS